MDHWNRIETPELNSWICKQLMNPPKKGQSLQQMLGILDLCMQKHEIWSLHFLHILKLVIANKSKVKLWNHQVTRGKWELLQNIGLSKYFLHETPEAQEIKANSVCQQTWKKCSASPRHQKKESKNHNEVFPHPSQNKCHPKIKKKKKKNLINAGKDVEGKAIYCYQ